MPEFAPPFGLARDAMRRLRASISAAAGLDEIATVLPTACASLRPFNQFRPAVSGGRGANQHTFASVPHWPAHRWVTTPTPRISPPVNPTNSSGTEARQPVRTGELTLPAPITNHEGEVAQGDDTVVASDGSGETQSSEDLSGVAAAETKSATTAEAESTETIVKPLRPAMPFPDAMGERVVSDQPIAPARAHDRWRGATQLITLLLAGEELGALLRVALKVSVQSFGVAGALIHLRDEYSQLTERVFALGEPAFEATLRATARRVPSDGLNPAATERGESLTVRYPHRLIVPIPAAGGTLGEFYLFRSALQRFSLEETEDARSFASILAVVLEQTRLRQQQVRQSEILTIQRKLADRLTGAATPEAAAEIGVAICAEAFGSGMASLHRYEEQARRLVMAAACGLPVPFVSGNAHVALGVGVCGQAAQRRALVVVEDVAADPDWMSTWHVKEHAVNLGSVWSLPLIGSDDQLLGALTIYHGRPVNAAEHDVILLHLIGQQIATALDRAGLVDRSRER